jgi:hypothetical protein
MFLARKSVLLLLLLLLLQRTLLHTAIKQQKDSDSVRVRKCAEYPTGSLQ